MTWEYEGQAVFDTSYQVPSEIFDSGLPDPIQTLGESLVGMIKIDGEGRRWRSIAVDEDELPAAAHEAWARTMAEAATAEPEEPSWGVPFGWTSGTCTVNTGTWALDIWDAESLTSFSSAPNPRHKRVVEYRVSPGSAQTCSGVVVEGLNQDKVRILTAAHCVLGNAVDAICSQGNRYNGADCITTPIGGFEVRLNPQYNGVPGSDFKDDYALITFERPGPGVLLTDEQWLTGIGPTDGMVLSQESNSSIEASQAGVYGYPNAVNLGSCTDTNDPTQAVESTFVDEFSRRLYYEWRTDHNVGTAKIKSKWDGREGQSGGAILTCAPYTTCPGEWQLAGLFVARFNDGGAWRTGGPKSNRMIPFLVSDL